MRSLASLASASASDIRRCRSDSALATSDWRTRAPSEPARVRLAESSVSSGTPSSVPRRPTSSHGGRPRSRVSSSGRRNSSKAHPRPTAAASCSDPCTGPPLARLMDTRSRNEDSA